MAYNTVQEALDKALKEKNKYQENLVGKTFAYAYINKFTNIISIKEIVFKRENYLHLTGLDYRSAQYKKRVLGINAPTYADEFYDRLGTDGKLINDVDFIIESTAQKTLLTLRHTQNKLDNLSQIVNIAKKAEYIAEYNDPNKYDLIINRNKETLAFIKDGDVYVPMSSRHGDVNKFINGNSKSPVLAIFSKSEGQKNYQIEYLNASVKFDKAQFDKETYEKLSLSSFENPNVKFNKEKLNILIDRFLHTEEKYISLDLCEIAELRRNAFSSDEAYNAYESKCKEFFNQMDTEHKQNYAIAVLNEQLEQTENSGNFSEDKSLEDIATLIKSELSEIKSRQRSLCGAANIYKFESKLPGNMNSDTIVISFKEKLKIIWEDMRSSFRSKVDEVKNTIKKLFDFSHIRHETTGDKNSDMVCLSEKENTKCEIESPSTVTEISDKPTALAALIESREAFAEGGISQEEYRQAVKDFMHTLQGEMWIEAADTLRKQLNNCPEEMKKYVGYELKNLEINIDKKFALKRQQTFDELSKAAKENYIKMQKDKETVGIVSSHSDKNRNER